MTDTNLSVLDSTGATKYLKQSGAGSSNDPNVAHHILDAGSVATVTADGVIVTGETVETGGSGMLGWLSSIRHGITALVAAALGTTADAAASTTVVQDTTPRTGIGLWKGILNRLIGGLDVPTATPTVYNVTLTTANTEYSQALPANTRGFEFQCQSSFDVRYAFVTGKVATPTAPYMTCKAGNAYSSFQLNQGASPSTLYFASPQAGVVVEITAWS
jgi:hypothetical protein